MVGIFRALIIDDDRDLLALIRLTLEYTAVSYTHLTLPTNREV